MNRFNDRVDLGTTAKVNAFGHAHDARRQTWLEPHNFGDVVDPISGQRLTEHARGLLDRRAEIVAGSVARPGFASSTTIAVVIVHAACDFDTLVRCAISAHDGFARAVRPCHTPFDGDLVFAVALSDGDVSSFDALRFSVAAELAVEAAIVDAVTA